MVVVDCQSIKGQRTPTYTLEKGKCYVIDIILIGATWPQNSVSLSNAEILHFRNKGYAPASDQWIVSFQYVIKATSSSVGVTFSQAPYAGTNNTVPTISIIKA